MIARRIRWKIIRTVLCCVVYVTVIHNDTYTHRTYEQLLKMSAGLGLAFACVCLCLAFFVFSDLA